MKKNDKRTKSENLNNRENTGGFFFQIFYLFMTDVVSTVYF